MNPKYRALRRLHILLLLAVIGPAGSNAQKVPTYSYELPEPKNSDSVEKPEFTRDQFLLMRAIWDQDLDAAEHLLRNGLSPNFLFRLHPEDMFATPLGESIADGNSQMATLCFKYGAQADFGEKEGAGALGRAVWNNDEAMVKELLKRGATVDARDDEGYTPLLVASYQTRDVKIIKLLIVAGADVKATSSKSQRTAIMLAASNLNLEAVKLFLDFGVDPCAKDSSGETAIDAADWGLLTKQEKDTAKEQVRDTIVKLLQSRCVHLEKSVHLSSKL